MLITVFGGTVVLLDGLAISAVFDCECRHSLLVALVGTDKIIDDRLNVVREVFKLYAD